ncbi:MAG TPA: universal stress protein [Gammaproteobacteria bacterium]|nr:universal stress protein [Gammaproteobacteria bacterium]
MAAETPAGLQRVLAVIDPERLIQPAFERAEWIAARNGALLHLFCCLGDRDVAAGDPAGAFSIRRVKGWLERLTKDASQYGLETEIEVVRDPNWRERIATTARDSNADLIVKTVSRHSGLTRQLKTTADWTLLETANRPVLLIDPLRPSQPKKVLAAVKLNPDSEEYEVLNREVVAMSRRIATALDAELDAVTVYKGDEIHFDRQKFADSCGLPRNRVHSFEGAPHKGIADAARELGADILVIGCANRHLKGSGTIIGDTARRIIDAVDTDLVVIPSA